MIVLDTNVVSELMRSSPATPVREWIHVRRRRGIDLYTTSITLAEVLYGVERLPDGRRKEQLRTTAESVFGSFEDQILAFEAVAAVEYASIVTTRDDAGRPISGFDAQFAAICLSHNATLATRNRPDFEGTGVTSVDPWATEDESP